MKVLFVTYEAAPLFKFGGLGDVAGSLPKALRKLGVDIRIGMPLYRILTKTDFLPGTNVPVIFAESPLFQKPGIIGNNKTPKNRVVAFVHFSEKLLDTVKKLDFCPDIIHINEWHGGLIPWLIKTKKDPFFQNTKTLVTIHNSLYQGIFLVKDIVENPTTRAIGKEIKDPANLFVNITEISLRYADWISTVSPTFADEILRGTFDFGLKKVILPKRNHFVGIINGLDTSVWNPALDVHIPLRYTLAGVEQAKEKNKYYLQKKMHLTVDSRIPLFSYTARLVWQKGLGILLASFSQLARLPLQLVVLGTGDRDVIDTMNSYSRKFPGKITIVDKYEEPLAHELFAASDFFLMPSIFEPCGLTQLMGMAYGVVPIVNPVGGLKDTVRDKITGLYMKKYTQNAFLTSIAEALNIWKNKDVFHRMRNHAMTQDFSWNKSAGKYFRLYEKMTENS